MQSEIQFMRILAELDDTNLALKNKGRRPESEYAERYTARAVIFRQDKCVALLYSQGFGYHLPGGGIKKEENWKEAILRESLEEIGCQILLRDHEVGAVVEYRGYPTIGQTDGRGLKQTSYCGIADVVSEGSQRLSTSEKAQKVSVTWIDLKNAIKLCEQAGISDGKPLDRYEAPFVKARELAFLKEVKRILVD